MKKLSLSKLMMISCASIFAILVLLLSPIYIRINSDIILRETLFTKALYLVIQLFEILAFSTAASLIIHAAISQHPQKSWNLFGIYCIATILRRLIALFMSLATFGYLDNLEIFSTGIYTLFDAAQMCIITTMVVKIATNYKAQTSIKQKAAVRLGDLLDNNIDFSKVFSRANPYAKCAIAAAAIISATKICTRTIFDVFAGLPEGWIEIVSMVIGYLSDMLIFAMAYAICWLITSRLYSKNI